ncbi:MAG: phenylalanine--tRNA ligase subunit beta, partial [Epsilonproteobacteria bacterium]|nr:phenylalanine--tRNA ligase subunit beta [Campylobacterota bacterium]
MIVTRSWLQEWIDLADVETEKIVRTLNGIGLEVAGVQKLSLPSDVVVAKVLSCQKHPDADKLHVCEVDAGGERLQIVCGAKNAPYAKYVALAKVGAKLPGGVEIKPARIRGVESEGMLCSARELGLPQIEDGILLLDDSIGAMEPGKELREYPAFQDEIIEIELTANRGDCLSVLGIARELSAALGKPLRTIDVEEDNSLQIGIGRLLNLNVASEIESNLLYKAFSARNFSNPFLIRLRLALIGERFDNRADEFGYYITHSTGVITRIYGYRFFEKEEPAIALKKDEKGFDAVYGKEKGSIVGVIQFKESKPKIEEERFVVEASYVDPETISRRQFEAKLPSDWAYYRSSRGSEPRLDLAMRYLKFLLKKYYREFMLYAGTHEVIKEIEKRAIKIDFDRLDALVGQKIERSEIVEILKSLEFEIVNVTEDSIVVKTPIFRHDIKNLQDVAEEIVRMYGIDRIDSKPLCFVEHDRTNEAMDLFYKKKLVRTLAVGNGYFESISFVFTRKKRLEEFGYEVVREDLDLINPITNELDTLRTSLVPNLLHQVAENVKTGKKRIKLFEVG